MKKFMKALHNGVVTNGTHQYDVSYDRGTKAVFLEINHPEFSFEMSPKDATRLGLALIARAARALGVYKPEEEEASDA